MRPKLLTVNDVLWLAPKWWLARPEILVSRSGQIAHLFGKEYATPYISQGEIIGISEEIMKALRIK